MLTAAFWGTPELVLPALHAVAAHAKLLGVVTQPDRPAGRHKTLRAPPVKTAALALNLPVYQVETLKGVQAGDLPDWLRAADIWIVMAYGLLLPSRLLAVPPRGAINLHASLLPRWRGASPLHAALRAGDTVSGVTVMRMVREMDAGAMYLTETLDLAARETLSTLHDRMAPCASAAVTRYLQNPDMPGVEQDHSAATVCHKLLPEHGHLKFSDRAVELDRQIRAYTPAPGCWVMADADRLAIHAAIPADAPIALSPGQTHAEHGRAWVGTAQGALELQVIQFPGRKALPVREVLNGHKLPPLLS